MHTVELEWPEIKMPETVMSSRDGGGYVPATEVIVWSIICRSSTPECSRVYARLPRVFLPQELITTTPPLLCTTKLLTRPSPDIDLSGASPVAPGGTGNGKTGLDVRS